MWKDPLQLPNSNHGPGGKSGARSGWSFGGRSGNGIKISVVPTSKSARWGTGRAGGTGSSGGGERSRVRGGGRSRVERVKVKVGIEVGIEGGVKLKACF